tara:strand:- start:104 stop:691 length:588 start_codon:yes stop_codon:yes gene_type:complete
MDVDIKEIQKMYEKKLTADDKKWIKQNNNWITEAAPDNTRNEAFQVFGEKSAEGNKIQENASKMFKDMGMSEQDILNLVMGVTPMGAVGAAGKGMSALKGLGKGLKGLVGKIKSKVKFPEGYNAPQSPGKTSELPAFIRKQLDKVEPNPLKQEAIKQQEIRKALDQLMQPNTVVKEEGIKKGMRQFGKFNRQLNK